MSLKYEPASEPLRERSSSLRLHLGSPLLVLKKDIHYILPVRLRLDVFNDETNVTQTELEGAHPNVLFVLVERFALRMKYS